MRQRMSRTPLRFSPHVGSRSALYWAPSSAPSGRRHRRANGRVRARCGIPSSHPAARLAVCRYPPLHRHCDAPLSYDDAMLVEWG